jgi:hypothetical protein
VASRPDHDAHPAGGPPPAVPEFRRFDDSGYPLGPEPRQFPAWPAIVVAIVGVFLLFVGLGITGAVGIGQVPTTAAATGRVLTLAGLGALILGLVGGAVRSLSVRRRLPATRYRGPAILLLFALVLVLGNTLSLPFASQLAGALLGEEQLPAGVAILVLVITPIAFLVVTWLFVLLPRALEGLQLTDGPATLRNFLKGLGYGIPMWIAAALVSAVAAGIWTLVTGTPPVEEQAVVNLLGPLPLPLALLAAAVLAPLAEELFFRGVVFNAWERERGIRWAVTGSAVLFAAVHLLDGALLVFFPILLVGLALASVYRRTRSLPTVFGMHAAFNSISLLLAFFATQAAP